LDSSYKLAVNSIPGLKKKRLDDAKKIYNEFIIDYPESEYLKEAEKKILDIDKEITIFTGT
jgi:TolA-binding protein